MQPASLGIDNYTKYGIFMIRQTYFKKVIWLGSSRKAMQSCPEAVKDEIGHALRLIQEGKMTPSVKPLKGFHGAGVIEIIDNYQTDTYRAVCTIRFVSIIYVLHVFKKKSKKGIATPKQDINLIQKRLKEARGDYEQNY